jgi:hypothetical protein
MVALQYADADVSSDNPCEWIFIIHFASMWTFHSKEAFMVLQNTLISE